MNVIKLHSLKWLLMVHNTLSKGDVATLENMEKKADLLTISGKFSAARKLLNRLLLLIPRRDYLSIGRINRKIGNTYNQQWQFKPAETFYAKAELSLMKVKEPAGMWKEWIELQTDYSYVVMHLRKAKLFKKKKEKLKSIIEIHGDLSQKARYISVIFTDILWKNGWYMLPDETIMVCEGIINIAEAENNFFIKITLQNMLAFTFLFRHEFKKAREIGFEYNKGCRQKQLWRGNNTRILHYLLQLQERKRYRKGQGMGS
jgi:hypothetical protein